MNRYKNVQKKAGPRGNTTLSRRLHRYMGLVLSIAGVYMALSGILLNHEHLIEGMNWPGRLLPSDMKVTNWGRSAVTTAIPWKEGRRLMGGRLGVVVAFSDGQCRPMNRGLGEAVRHRTVHSLYYDGDSLTLAGGARGLFRWNGTEWTKLGVDEPVVSILETPRGITAFSRSGAWVVTEQRVVPVVSFRRAATGVLSGKMSMVRFFFDLHSGALFGLPGRLVMDGVALLLLLFSLGGLAIYFRLLRRPGLRMMKRPLRFLHRLHLLRFPYVGWFFIATLLLLSATGFFMRPPFIMALAGKYISVPFHQEPVDTTRWHGQIERVVHDPARDTLIVQAGGVLYEGPLKLDAPFRPLVASMPVHPMGVTALAIDSDGTYLVGSFSGLVVWDRRHNRWYEYFSQRPVAGMVVRQQGPFQVNGHFPWKGRDVIVDYRKGLFFLDTGGTFLPMPREFHHATTFSLWNFAFELHNGRIYKSLFPRLYILHNPLAAIGFTLLAVTGILILARRGLLRKKKPSS